MGFGYFRGYVDDLYKVLDAKLATAFLFSLVSLVSVGLTCEVKAFRTPTITPTPTATATAKVGRRMDVYLPIVSGGEWRRPIDILDYYLPRKDVVIYMHNGEVFNSRLATINNSTGFYVMKDEAGTGFEEFTYDEDVIYHLKDTTWPEKCTNGKSAYFTMLNGHHSGDTCQLNLYSEGGHWVKRRMKVGETDNSESTIVAFDKATNSCCDTLYSGAGKRSVKLVSVGKWESPYGPAFEDVVRLAIIDGIGKGENFYLANGYGWVGFEVRKGNPVRGDVVQSAYAEKVKIR